MSISKKIFILLYFSAILLFLAHFKIVGKAVYGDGMYYYSYLPTFFVYHTINPGQAFAHLGIHSYLTPLHYQANKYSIGSAVVWTIPFLFVHFLLMPFHLNDGYNSWYQIAIGLWNISLVFVGLYFLKNPLQQFFSETTSFFTILFLFVGTNLLFYGAIDVINSHSASFFAACMVIYLWFQKSTVKQSLLLGFFLGLLTLIRSQDGIFIILPLSTLIIKRFSYLSYFFLIVIAAAITYSPQLFLWHALWGSWYVNPYLFHEQFYFLHPQLLGVLFGMKTGLFLWTPLIIFCVLGLCYFAKKNKHIGIPMLLIFLLELYIISSWATWWQGGSYSGRMFVSSLPILAFGLAYLLSQKRWYKQILFTSLLLCLLNPILIIYYLLYIQ